MPEVTLIPDSEIEFHAKAGDDLTFVRNPSVQVTVDFGNRTPFDESQFTFKGKAKKRSKRKRERQIPIQVGRHWRRKRKWEWDFSLSSGGPSLTMGAPAS